MILDFGCGQGGLVGAFSSAGFEAYGCDFPYQMSEQINRLRPIESPYRIPFDDDTFDCVISNTVFEHIQDYGEALREIRRVLRPCGVSLNIFPARYSLREKHVFVPLATIIQSHPWLLLWARLGIRNSFQQDKGAREVADLNAAFLADHTTYYRRRQILALARQVFPDARLLGMEVLAARPGRRARTLLAVVGHLSPLAWVWSEVRTRALLLT